MMSKFSYTIVATPRAFDGVHDIRQHNAITSWTLLQPRPKILLCGNDDGAEAAARLHACVYIPEVLCDRDGIPLIHDIFRIALERAQTDLTVYVNCDILLPPNFPSVLFTVADRFQDFLMVGSRWDTNVDTRIDFDETWHRRLLSQKGRPHPPGGTDYVAFPTDHWKDNLPPPFAVGRCRWDNYLIGNAVDTSIQVVDVTSVLRPIHQNIPPEKRVTRKCDRIYIELWRAARIKRMGNLSDTQWILDEGGFRERWP